MLGREEVLERVEQQGGGDADQDQRHRGVEDVLGEREPEHELAPGGAVATDARVVLLLVEAVDHRCYMPRFGSIGPSTPRAIESCANVDTSVPSCVNTAPEPNTRPLPA